MRQIGGLALAFILAACASTSPGTSDSSGTTPRSSSSSGDTTVTSSTAPEVADTGAATDTETSSVTTGPNTSEPSTDELAVFIAVAEELLSGTVYEGEALNEPELFLATGWLFCDWLDDGDAPDTVLERYLDELAGGVEAATDDQLVVAGAVLGAAVGVLCPRHDASLDD